MIVSTVTSLSRPQPINLSTRIEETNVGHQLLKKMGMSIQVYSHSLVFVLFRSNLSSFDGLFDSLLLRSRPDPSHPKDSNSSLERTKYLNRHTHFLEQLVPHVGLFNPCAEIYGCGLESDVTVDNIMNCLVSYATNGCSRFGRGE